MAQRSYRSVLLRVLARWLQTGADLVRQQADAAGRLAPEAERRGETPREQTPSEGSTESGASTATGQEPATSRRPGEPPAHWLERAESGGPPQHWLDYVQSKASAQDSVEQLSAEAPEVGQAPSPVLPSAGESWPGQEAAGDGDEKIPASRLAEPRVGADALSTRAGAAQDEAKDTETEPARRVPGQAARETERVESTRRRPTAGSAAARPTIRFQPRATSQGEAQPPASDAPQDRSPRASVPALDRQPKPPSSMDPEHPSRKDVATGHPDAVSSQRAGSERRQPRQRHAFVASAQGRSAPQLVPGSGQRATWHSTPQETASRQVPPALPSAPRSADFTGQRRRPPVPEPPREPEPVDASSRPELEGWVDHEVAPRGAPVTPAQRDPSVPERRRERHARDWASGGAERSRWPSLLEQEPLVEDGSMLPEDWEAQWRAWQRLQRLDREQRGFLWSESPS